MNQVPQATGALDDARLQHASRLGVLVAKINATPEDVGPIQEAFCRVLDIASFAPGGQQALLDRLADCEQVQEVLAFCRAFVHLVAIDCGGAQHAEGVINPVHDLGDRN